MKPIVIYGAGGFAREVLELIRDLNDNKPTWHVLGFLDDNQESWGTTLNDIEILGGADWLEGAATRPFAVLGVGSPVVKRKIVQRIRNDVAGFPTLVHPTVVHSRWIDYGRGVVVTAGNILTANVKIGDFAMLNLMCTVGHDCVIGDYVTLSPGANVSGYVRIGEGCDIGTGTKVVPGITIGEWSLVGAGAVVAGNLPANCTAVGVPARPIKERQPGWYEE